MLNWTVLNGNSNLCLYAVCVLAGDYNHSYGDAKDPVAGCRQDRWKIENFLMSAHSVVDDGGAHICILFYSVQYVCCVHYTTSLCAWNTAWCAPFGM